MNSRGKLMVALANHQQLLHTAGTKKKKLETLDNSVIEASYDVEQFEDANNFRSSSTAEVCNNTDGEMLNLIRHTSHTEGEDSEVEEEEECFDNSDQDKDFSPESGSESESENSVTSEGSAASNGVVYDANELSGNETEILEKSEKKSRKRKRNVDQWGRNIRKRNRNIGIAYTTLSKKPVPAKSLKPACNEHCRLKCSSAFNLEEREQILRTFWAIGDITRQRQYVSGNITEITPKYRYPKQATNRASNQAYYLHCNNQKVRVCKKNFMATLDIGDTMIRTTLKKRDDKNLIGPEKRGKHQNQKRLDPSLKQGVRAHIDSIPRVESHYLRNQTEREYFEGDLNLSTLYRMYKEKSEEEGKHVVKQCIYNQIFNTEYNIGWHKPKKDQCNTCETFKNCSDEEKQVLSEDYHKHIEDKELSREEKRKDIEEATINNNKIIAVCDLQAVLICPCGDVSQFYYKSKLATYNFSIFNIVPKQGYCYVWNESCAKRGANEISTCVLDFLKNYCEGKEDVVFYSDNCGGQNKNKFVASMYMFAVTNLNIVNITHKFLTAGHTQNEGDSMHSCIEREKKRVLKGGPIYVPAQWVPVIKLAKKNGKPYVVTEIDTSDILDFKQFSSEIGTNYNINIKKEKVNWNNIKILHFKKETPFSMYYKCEYSQKDYEEIDVRPRRSSRLPGTQLNLKLAYSEPPPISKQKKEGLMFLCSKNVIKKQYHSFYENLATD